MSAGSRESVFCHFGRSLISRYVETLKDETQDPGAIPIPRNMPAAEADVVGILGAGVGGLYTAIMLHSLGIPFEIIEGSDRIGGRLHTHKFNHPQAGKYDYYDIGAMRYPLPPKDANGDYINGMSRRLGHLFNFLGMQNKLIPYYFSSDPDHSPPFKLFNNVRVRSNVHSDWNASALGIRSDIINVGTERILEDVVGPFALGLFRDTREEGDTKGNGWKVMMRNDIYSTRAYMCLKYIPSASFALEPEHLETNVVNWIETLDTGTGTFDRSLTESVLEAVAFGAVGGEVLDWKCIDGGSYVLPATMEEFLKEQTGQDLITLNAPVTFIGLEEDREDSPLVVVAGGTRHRYSHVVSTIPLPILRTIDMTKSKLDLIQENALRQLQYGPSIKIGILFTDNWWTTGSDKDGVPFNIVGGQSTTDLPIRTIVYPSHGANTNEPSKVLIASYCWTSDAERLGAWFQSGDQTGNERLKELVFKNLAAVHNVTYDYLETKFLLMHAWDFNDDEYAMGAFPHFGPGNFENLYDSLNRPAAYGRLHFAGDALSIRHAWVVGALDSAWRAVYDYLYLTDKSKLETFFEMWGINREWFDKEVDLLPEPSRRSPPGKAGLELLRSKSILEKYLRRCSSKAA